VQPIAGPFLLLFVGKPLCGYAHVGKPGLAYSFHRCYDRLMNGLRIGDKYQ
jgi:hypothetical protein